MGYKSSYYCDCIGNRTWRILRRNSPRDNPPSDSVHHQLDIDADAMEWVEKVNGSDCDTRANQELQ